MMKANQFEPNFTNQSIINSKSYC